MLAYLEDKKGIFIWLVGTGRDPWDQLWTEKGDNCMKGITLSWAVMQNAHIRIFKKLFEYKNVNLLWVQLTVDIRAEHIG